jgi:hypothetical protein
MDMKQHLMRQMAWSRATFGPHPRTAGVIDHIRKELVEVEESNGSAAEWTDVAILAMDGLWRSVRAAHPHSASSDVAQMVIEFILRKQDRNELRDWPDWRTAPTDKAIEHVRT